MPAENMKKARSIEKRAVTNMIGHMKEDLQENAPTEDIRHAIEALKGAYKTFSRTHENLMKSLGEDDKALHEGERYKEEVRGRYLALSVANMCIKELEGGTASSTGPVSSATRDELQYIMSLPKLTLEQFDGNPMMFHIFMAVFEQNVGCLPRSDAAKLARLPEYTAGKAREAIQKCSLIGGKKGYDKAMEILKTCFDDEQLITKRLIDGMKKGPPVNE